jgi:hypothetical protein
MHPAIDPVLTTTWPVSDPLLMSLWLGALASVAYHHPVCLDGDLGELAEICALVWPARARA